MLKRGNDRSPAHLVIDRGLCHHCGACVAVCAADALCLLDSCLTVRQELCVACAHCLQICPLQALSLANAPQGEEVP